MSWLHAFRFAAGSLQEHQVDEVRAVMAVNGYRTTTEMWWIDEVHRVSDGAIIYQRQRFGGDATHSLIQRDVLRRLPVELIETLNNRFGVARIDTIDDADEYEVIIDELDDTMATPNVGAATVLPLPK